MRSVLLAALMLVASPPRHPWRISAQPASSASGSTGWRREMRAVQRKVFPGGDQQYFEAEIVAAAGDRPHPRHAGQLARVDLTARVDALERKLARLTGTAEQNAFTQQSRQLEEADENRFKGDCRVPPECAGGLAQPPAAGGGVKRSRRPVRPRTPSAVTGIGIAPVTSGPDRATRQPDVRRHPAAPRYDPVAPRTVGRWAVRRASSTGDPGEDAYMAGYKLWMDKKLSRGGGVAEGHRRQISQAQARELRAEPARPRLSGRRQARGRRRSLLRRTTRRCRAASARPTASIISASR